jgi:hypothetical protein
MTQRLREILIRPPRDAMEQFLFSWYGAPACESPASERLEMAMPEPLRRLYSLLAERPDVIVQNVVLSPPGLPPLESEPWAKTRVDEGRLIFYVENQGVCEWATSLTEDDDARVWIRGSTLGRDLTTWELEEPPLSAFLLQLLVFEAIIGAEHGVSVAWLDREALGRIVEPLERLTHGSWRWPSYPSDFYVGNRVLAFAGPNPGPDESEQTAEYVSLSLGALDADAIAYLDDVAQPGWEWFSRQDRPAGSARGSTDERAAAD